MDEKAVLRELRAESQIRAAIARVCRGTDRLDRNMILSGYHPGARDRHGAFDGPVEEFADWVFKNHSGRILSSVHHIGNVLIEFDDHGARSETYVLVVHRLMIDGTLNQKTSHGRLLDRFEERDGKWLIADRLVVLDWTRLEVVDEDISAVVTRGLAPATRTPNDPSYGVLRSSSS